MKRFFGLLLLTVVAAATTFAQVHQRQANARTKAEKEVIACLDALTEAGLKRDVAALDRLYVDSYFHTNPDGSLMSKAQVLASYQAPPTATIDFDQHDEDKVWVQGNVAFVNTLVTIRGRRGDNPYERRYRVTYLFEKLRNKWRAVTSHATLILEPAK